MANLPEDASWQEGIYQIETVDPVVGGPDGISNVQARQLANRTAYLKEFADEVEGARGDAENLNDRLAGYDTFSPGHQIALLAGVQEALGLAGVLGREMDVMRKRVLAQGVVVLKNKFVMRGMRLTKSEIRALHLSETGTLGSGVSVAQIDGITVSLPDDDYHVSVPTNETGTAQVYFAFLRNTAGSTYEVEIAQEVPDDALTLYRLDIPANNTGNDLSAVDLTDLRVVQPASSWISSFDPFVSVAFGETLPGADYSVALEVEAATNVAAVGALVAYDKATNGFKIRQTGSADNVRIRWSLLNIHYQ